MNTGTTHPVTTPSTLQAPQQSRHANPQKRPGKGGKPPQDSPQLQYAKEIARLARFYRDAGGGIYEWRGSHFATVDPERADRHAFDYLEQHFPDRATPQLARSCSDTVKIKAPMLPARDQKKLVIPLRNAYLEVRKGGTVHRHAPDKKFGITYVLNTSLPTGGPIYAPKEPDPASHVGQFLRTSIPDQQLRDYVQELAGNTLTPDTKFQKAMLLKGSGANGKSVFMKILSALHAVVASMRLNELSGFQLMPIIGASLVMVDEVPRFGINEQVFKTLISGEAVTIDRKHRNPVRYTPTAKWIIATNNDQKMQDNSHGLWRRFATIPFNEQITPGDVVPGLDRVIIEQELSLLLDWCLIGLQRLLQRGSLPPEPTCVTLSKREAIEASNSVAAWRTDQCVAAGTAFSFEKQGIYDDYRCWCQSQGLRSVSANVFWKGLKDLLPSLQDEQRRVAKGRQRFVNLTFADDAPDIHEVNPFTNN